MNLLKKPNNSGAAPNKTPVRKAKESAARKTAGAIRIGRGLLVISCIGELLLTHGVHDAADDETRDRRQDQRAAEGISQTALAPVQEAKDATDHEDDPGGLPPALPIGHA